MNYPTRIPLRRYSFKGNLGTNKFNSFNVAFRAIIRNNTDSLLRRDRLIYAFITRKIHKIKRFPLTSGALIGGTPDPRGALAQGRCTWRPERACPRDPSFPRKAVATVLCVE